MNYAIILAGGTGSRAGGPLPKQFQKVGGKRIIWRSVEAFRNFDPSIKIIVALHGDFMNLWNNFLEEEGFDGSDFKVVEGGETRFGSVKNALEFIERSEILGSASGCETEDMVFIHDAARPLVSIELIARGKECVEKGVGGIPVIPVTDTIRMVSNEGTKVVDRSLLLAVQTPQVFMLEDIAAAYRNQSDSRVFTDDASVAEAYGLKINTFEGDPKNFKITNPDDIKRMEALLPA